MDEVLKESGEARKQAISLRHVQYGGDLVDKLMAHSTQMEKIYSCFQNLFTQPDAKDSKFLKLMALANEKRGWFETAKAGQPSVPSITSVYMCFKNMPTCFQESLDKTGFRTLDVNLQDKMIYDQLVYYYQGQVSAAWKFLPKPTYSISNVYKFI